ncbi:hypothetical protein B0H14DRAFT_2560603 [Mycena olivaceomarginata]|nr:hypothetical protein B0H14DRAFT_2560603 [Mycena olivaceomarginata]
MYYNAFDGGSAHVIDAVALYLRLSKHTDQTARSGALRNTITIATIATFAICSASLDHGGLGSYRSVSNFRVTSHSPEIRNGRTACIAWRIWRTNRVTQTIGGESAAIWAYTGSQLRMLTTDLAPPIIGLVNVLIYYLPPRGARVVIRAVNRRIRRVDDDQRSVVDNE